MLNLLPVISGNIEALEVGLVLSSANTANSATTGYKSFESTFQSVFNRVLQQASAGRNAIQTGGAMAIASSRIDFSQGDLSASSNLSIGISGNGLFIVSPDNGTTLLYSRNGAFQLNSEGFLVNDQGMNVMGFPTDTSGNRMSSAIQPIKLTNVTNAGADNNGLIGEATTATDASGATVITVTSSQFQIALSTFKNREGLEALSGTLYRETLSSGEPTAPAAPGINTEVGRVFGGQIENSNVFSVGESITQTALEDTIEANISVIQTINNIIQSAISKLA